MLCFDYLTLLSRNVEEETTNSKLQCMYRNRMLWDLGCSRETVQLEMLEVIEGVINQMSIIIWRDNLDTWQIDQNING